MKKRVRATGKAQVQARHHITGGCDTDKNIIVAAIFEAQTGHLEVQEFSQHREDALQAAEWFKARQVELVVIESTANYHLLYYDVLRQQGINMVVINPLVVKSLLRVEGKSDKGDAMTLARLAASFDLKTSNMPDSQQRELRLLFKRLDSWKVSRTQITNRINGILTGHGFTVFRLVAINSRTGLRIIQALIDKRTPPEIAALHPRHAKRPEIEKCAAVELPDYLLNYLEESLADINTLNQRIAQGEAQIMEKMQALGLQDQVQLMCTVPAVTPMLSMRIIAEMGENFHQRYYSAEAFAKAIGVVPSNEVSGGKLLKRRASHGNKRVKFHLLSTAKAFAIHGQGPLREWYNSLRSRSNYMKAISALARRMSEGLWWVMTRNEAYKYQHGNVVSHWHEIARLEQHLVDTKTGEVFEPLDVVSEDVR